jgi:hypothetical protein
LIVFVIALVVKDLLLGTALFAGLLAMLLHTLTVLLHQAGHALAARRSGHPMSGIATYWVITNSLYPKDEAELSPQIHIQRALGGQYLSLPWFILAILLTIGVLPNQGMAGVLVVFLLIDAFVFSLGALIPVPAAILETDGTTLQKWWPKRNQSPGQPAQPSQVQPSPTQAEEVQSDES